MPYSARVDGSKPRTNFFRSVALLTSAAGMAHAITALSMPVLSRIYSPTDFSVLAVFTSLVSIIGVAAGLRFDVAVSIPDNDSDAVNLLGLSLFFAGAVAALLALLVLWMPEQVSAWLNQPKIAPFLWLLPIGIFLSVGYSGLQGWFLRRRTFGQIARARIAQSLAGTSSQISMGLVSASPFGLLLGYIINTGVACLTLGTSWLRSEHSVFKHLTWLGMKRMAYEHHRFPKYSTLESISNSAAIQLPIIMIAAIAAGPEAGYLAMAMYAMQAPMALVGTAIGQVYLSRAPEEYRAGRISSFTADIFGGLLKAGVGPLLFFGIVSPIAFAFVFGEEWRRAGDLVAWMTPWFIMQFLASPISMALHVTNRQKLALILQIFSLFTRVATVWICATINSNWISEVYALSGFLVYLVYAAAILAAMSIQFKQIYLQFVKSIKYIASCVFFGVLARILFEMLY